MRRLLVILCLFMSCSCLLASSRQTFFRRWASTTAIEWTPEYLESTALWLDASDTQESIDNQFKGGAFNIARVIVYTGLVGTRELVETQDKRGELINALGTGGGASAAQTFPDSAFRVYDNADATREIALEAGNITSGQLRTLTMLDADLDLADVLRIEGTEFNAQLRAVTNISNEITIRDNNTDDEFMHLGWYGSTGDQPALEIDGAGNTFELIMNDLTNMTWSPGKFDWEGSAHTNFIVEGTFTTNTPTDGQVAKYNATDGKWYASDVSLATSVPYTIPYAATVTVSRANGLEQAYAPTGPTTILIEDGGTGGVDTVFLSLYADTNSITFGTNNVTWDAEVTPSTNSTTSILYLSEWLDTDWIGKEE